MEGEEEWEYPEGQLKFDLHLEAEEIQDDLDIESDTLPAFSDDYKDVRDCKG